MAFLPSGEISFHELVAAAEILPAENINRAQNKSRIFFYFKTMDMNE